ncbi:hypothetical protein Tco_1392034 [Tanacetum coccineum]
MPTTIDMPPNDYSADISHVVYADESHATEDPNGTVPITWRQLSSLLSCEFQQATTTKRRHRTQLPQFNKLLLQFLIVLAKASKKIFSSLNSKVGNFIIDQKDIDTGEFVKETNTINVNMPDWALALELQECYQLMWGKN